jgi:hypothetical protein
VAANGDQRVFHDPRKTSAAPCSMSCGLKTV